MGRQTNSREARTPSNEAEAQAVQEPGERPCSKQQFLPGWITDLFISLCRAKEQNKSELDKRCWRYQKENGEAGT